MLFCLLNLSWSTFVLHSYFTGVVLSPRFKLEYFCVTFVLYWCCFTQKYSSLNRGDKTTPVKYECNTKVLQLKSRRQNNINKVHIRTLLVLFCLLDLSWSTFVLLSYFTDVVLSPQFKLEYFCVTFVLYWCCFDKITPAKYECNTKVLQLKSRRQNNTSKVRM
jgi:hypothetical protein